MPRPDLVRERVRGRIIALAQGDGRYGDRTGTDLLRLEGWDVGNDRVNTRWRQEGLNVPTKQPTRARRWCADGSSLRLRPAYRHHVWSSDVVADRTHDGRPFRMLTIFDAYLRECVASCVTRRIRSQDVLLILAELFLSRGIPTPLRSDHGPDFIASTLRRWLKMLTVEPLSIEPETHLGKMATSSRSMERCGSRC